MANKYYTPTGKPDDLARARAVQLREEFSLVEKGFDLVWQDLYGLADYSPTTQIINDNGVSNTTAYSSSKIINNFKPISHNHSIGDLSAAFAITNDTLYFDGSFWVPKSFSNIVPAPKIVDSMFSPNVNDRDVYVDSDGTAYVFIGAFGVWEKIGKLRYSETSGGFFGSIAAGSDYAVFLLEDGTCKAVGNNFHGQLGDGTRTSRTVPVQVIGVTNCVAVSAKNNFTVFLLADGTCKAVGYNYYGQLGDGTTTDRSTPVQVVGVTDCVAISAGWMHTVFLLSDGSCKAVGDNTNGQLGDGTTQRRLTPVNVVGVSDCVGVSAGEAHTVFLFRDGYCKAVGGNYFGELGIGSTPHFSTSTPISTSTPTLVGVSNCVSVYAGPRQTVFLLSDGTCKACGYNNVGQLGIGTVANTFTPTTVLGVTNCIHVAPSSMHTVFVLSDGTCKATGYNASGQLGDGTRTDKSSPVVVSGISNCIGAAAGTSFSIFLVSDGSCYISGLSMFFGVYVHSAHSTPVRLPINRVKTTSGSSSGGAPYYG